MDKHNATLKQLLDTLSENNGSADWNMYKTKRHKICVKICFDEPLDQLEVNNNLKTDNESSFGPTFKLVSETQTKRNFLRAKSYGNKGSFIIYGTGGGGIRRSGRNFLDAHFVVGEFF